ncbi:DUF934 domain-containing protein [Pseudochrobactrum kiredjianiae]|uniref:DUF934 domain-containing protein n=1 Tax=Pseudochrobactrum kiredjianiae TaxID=386305 RepID=A0ABW3V949_9HYPH|nr:DUF934 domain-containing protein [Pseudochrobactrum kiredjianiae]MDM7849846.1 DUF934 domain-containing protein [Pseudochrobactrum kiredjianiae]
MTETILPALWSRSGLTDDGFVHVESVEEITGHDAVIVPLQLWPQISRERLRTSNIRIGVCVEAGEALDNLLGDLAHIDLLVLDFPAFNDGRSFSKAARLRSHYEFTGEIRASGAVHIDQVSAMLRSGFDTLQISDARTLKRLLAGELHDTGVYYQPVAGGIHGAEQGLAGYSWRRRQGF